MHASTLSPCPITEATVADNIIERNQKNANITAIEYFDTQISYKEMFAYIELYAKAFRAIGVKPGEVVTLCLACTPDAIFAFYGLNKIGAIANCVNPNYFKIDGKKYMDQTRATTLFVLDRFYPMIRDALSVTTTKKVIISKLDTYASSDLRKLRTGFFSRIRKSQLLPGVQYLETDSFLACGQGAPAVMSLPYKPDRDAGIFYTSGTTGNPKGVVLTNDSLNNMIAMYDALDGMGRSPGDRNLVIIPPMYATGISHGLNAPFAFGCTNILQPIYDKYAFADDLKRYRPSTVTVTGSHYTALLESGLQKGDLDFLKFPCTGGEALTSEFAANISRHLMELGAQNPLIMGYGASEFGCMVMINQYLENRTNEAGYPMPYVKARIVDTKTGKVLGPNQRGEIQVVTPAIMKGYYKMPEKTASYFCCDADGTKWAKTGDLGSFDENGVYQAYGRIADSFINSSGKTIYLFDYEKTISKHPGVLECEAVAISVNGTMVPAIHLVLKRAYKRQANRTISEIHKLLAKEGTLDLPYCYKVRKAFATSAISAKRDYASLAFETDGFVMVKKDGTVQKIAIHLD